MTQQLSLHKNKVHPNDALWWKPFFSMQKEINKTLQELFSNSQTPSIIPSSFWDVEGDVFSSAQSNIHRLFSEMFNSRQMLTPWLIGNNTEPYVDIIENGKSFKIKAELPGLNAKDVDVSLSDSALTISGEKQEDKLEEGDNYIRRECHCGSFSRTIALPEEADLDNASASFDQNVLTIEVPKKAEAKSKTRKLNIESAPEEGSKKPEAVKNESSNNKKNKAA